MDTCKIQVSQANNLPTTETKMSKQATAQRIVNRRNNAQLDIGLSGDAAFKAVIDAITMEDVDNAGVETEQMADLYHAIKACDNPTATLMKITGGRVENRLLRDVIRRKLLDMVAQLDEVSEAQQPAG